jgi:hypothetical protein
MVDIITNATDQVFCLEEYCELVTQRVDMADIDSLREHAWLLRGLANNRDFLLERYHQMLEEFVSDKPVAVYTPQSLTLASGREFYVRANIWLPIENSSIQSDTKVKLNAYELPHDHSFDFVSVGYFGAVMSQTYINMMEGLQDILVNRLISPFRVGSILMLALFLFTKRTRTFISSSHQRGYLFP